jgi:hypothetical protein
MMEVYCGIKVPCLQGQILDERFLSLRNGPEVRRVSDFRVIGPLRLGMS